MNIRTATPKDAEQIAQLYFDTIHVVNIKDYTKEQVQAWAGNRPDPGFWLNRMESRITLVAEDDGTITAFCELEGNDHLDTFFCHQAYQKQGVGSMLLAAVEAEAISLGSSRIHTEASITARPFFEAKGYKIVKEQQVMAKGIEMTNFVMEKELKPEIQ